MTGEENGTHNNNGSGVKVPTGQINYNTVGASAGIASFLGLNARNILNGMGGGCGCNNGYNNGCQGGMGMNGVAVGYGLGYEQGSRRGTSFEDSAVTQIELGYAQEINKKDATISKLLSEKYTDNHILEAYRETVGLFKAEDEKISNIVKDVTASFIESGKELAVLNTKVQCLEERMVNMNNATNERMGYEIKGIYRDIHSTKKELEGAIALESERRCCGDKTLYEYVNGNFVPGKLVMPASSVCPQPMPQYNSWTAPTSTTATT